MDLELRTVVSCEKEKVAQETKVENVHLVLQRVLESYKLHRAAPAAAAESAG